MEIKIVVIYGFTEKSMKTPALNTETRLTSTVEINYSETFWTLSLIDESQEMKQQPSIPCFPS